MALPISGGNGSPASQANTQSPQTSAGSNSPAAAPAGKVQPGTANSLLSQTTGGEAVPLTNHPLTVVSLNTSAQTTASTSTKAPQPKHHLNPALLIIVVLLVILAIAFTWITAKSAKNTTH